MSGSLGSAPLPPTAPDDHVLGTGDSEPRLIVYADYECPYCAALHARLIGGEQRWVFRHFSVRSKHPRAWAAACAAEAAALQGAFEPMHMALYADQARLEDPHLWERARTLGLDVERFDADRRSDRGHRARAARLRERRPRRRRDDADDLRAACGVLQPDR